MCWYPGSWRQQTDSSITHDRSTWPPPPLFHWCCCNFVTENSKNKVTTGLCPVHSSATLPVWQRLPCVCRKILVSNHTNSLMKLPEAATIWLLEPVLEKMERCPEQRTSLCVPTGGSGSARCFSWHTGTTSQQNTHIHIKRLPGCKGCWWQGCWEYDQNLHMASFWH